MKTAVNVSDIFSNAASLVKKGWVQNQVAATRDGSMCLPRNPAATAWCAAGAITAIAGGNNEKLREVERCIALHFRCRTGNAFYRLTAFNDLPRRKQSEVVELLRKLAEQSVQA